MSSKFYKFFDFLLSSIGTRTLYYFWFVGLFSISTGSFAQNIIDSVYVPNLIQHTPDSILIAPTDTIRPDSAAVKPKKKPLESEFKYQSSDSTDIDLELKQVKLYRNAQVNYQGIELKAAYILLDMNTKTLMAYGKKDSLGEVYGKPQFKEGKEEFTADSMVYNFETKKGIIKGVFTQQGEGYLHSEINKKLANNEICIKNGKYTTCDHEHPHFYLALTKAKVIPDDKIVSGPAYLVIEDVVLPIGIPFGFFPNRKGGASGVIIPTYGDDLSRGFNLRDGGYYFYINDYTDTKFIGDIYSNGSWGLANETRYNVKYLFNGSLYGKYSKFLKNSDEPNKTEEVTYNIKWTHNQDPKAHPYQTFSASVDFGSSKFKQYNNTSQNDRLSTSQNSSISYNRRFANSPFSLSVNARQSQQTSINNTQNVGKMDFTLPELNLSMSRIQPLKRKTRVGSERWYEKIGFSYTGNFRNVATGIDEDTLWTNYTLQQFRNGVQHSIPLSISLNVLKYLNISPSISLTERWYFKSLDRYYNADSARVEIDTINGFARAGDFLISIPVSTKLYGMYQIKGKNPLVKAFRHIVTPTVSFSWRPDFSEPQWGYYQEIYHNDSLIGNYSRFEGGSGAWNGIYGSPAAGRSGMVNFNLSNNFEMKVRNRKDTVTGGKIIKLIDRLSVRTGYNMAVDTLNWSNVDFSAGTQIGQILNIDMSMNFDPYEINMNTGKRINYLLWQDGKLGRLNSANLSTGLRLTSKGLKNEKPNRNLSENERETLRNHGISDQMIDQGYADFSMPWNISVNYAINFRNSFNSSLKDFEETISQTLNINGSVNITTNWKASVTSGWDFQKDEVSYTSVTLMRDLHCWQMSFNWVPFGAYQSYYFKINVKSAMLQDLKYEQRRSWLEEL